MKYNKNADTLLLLLSCTKSQREKKKSKKHSLRVQALKKGEKQHVLGTLYHNIQHLTNLKNRFPVKFRSA